MSPAPQSDRRLSRRLPDLVPAALRREWSRAGYYPDRDVFGLFTDLVATDPDRAAVLDASGVHSRVELHDAALRLARGLRELGVEPGSVVCCQLPNSWRSVVVDLAVAALGGVVLPFPVGRGDRDVRALLGRSRAGLAVISRYYADVDVAKLYQGVRPEVPDLAHIVVDGPAPAGTTSLDDLLAGPALEADTVEPIDPDSAVRLLVSSGTEAEPKIVAYSHNALVGGRGRFLARLAPPDGSPLRGLFGVPLGSSFGSCATVGVLVTLGGSLVLLPRFDPGEVLAAIAGHRPTHVFGVPTMFQRLLGHPDLPRTDVSSLVAVVSGGATIDPPTAQLCVRRLGCAFVSLYGSADGVNCHTLLDDPLPVAQHTVGRPNATICDIRIADTADHPVRRGEVGEILARGPMSPLCYVHAPELDERYRTPDGWVRTGDRGFLDAEGRLRLVGRGKEIVIRGGANISPTEVELAVAAHQDVVSVACIGVPDADLGQRVCACVALRAGAPPLDITRLGPFLDAAGLERRKFPEQLVVLDELPVTPAGKVDKRALLELATRPARTGATPRDPVSVREAVRRFTEEEILPREALLSGPEGPGVLAELQRRARSAGLWGLYYPPELGGGGFTLPEYLAIGEQEGRTLHGPGVFGADATLDVWMLHESGSERVRREYLAPLAAGTAVAGYGMTEPGVSGSDASLLRTEARLAQGMWTVHGRKWFTCRGGRATFTTVVARTEALGRPIRGALSLIVVPAGTPGFRVVRSLSVLGLESDQWELEFADARVPEDHLVGRRGRGSAVIGRRLNLGRLLRAMHWSGQAQRAFDLMCLRMRRRRTLGGVLADKQLMHQHVFAAYTEICAARSLLRRAAAVFDAGLPTTSDVSAAKVAASRMVNDVLDRAVQVFGAEGLLHPYLSVAHRTARGTRIYDGPDEIHITTTAQRILAAYDDTTAFDFTDPLDGVARLPQVPSVAPSSPLR
ncbi:MAG: AMP-binding protein [Pseudonocardiales bacterium]|nr:AMP-binding protein [Pseudonocardiales bacterium]MBV9028735.1 AMP-binding protein [Pseudonocardiales bacterium]MBW0009843.1 AMP-binding protein [Pseudonocardiales bacterium]